MSVAAFPKYRILYRCCADFFFFYVFPNDNFVYQHGRYRAGMQQSKKRYLNNKKINNNCVYALQPFFVSRSRLIPIVGNIIIGACERFDLPHRTIDGSKKKKTVFFL